MAFLKFVWRIVRALLITVAVVIVMTAASFVWPVLLLLYLALPQTTGRLWAAAGKIKVF